MNKRLSILMIVIWKTEYKELAPFWSKKLQSLGSELIQRAKYGVKSKKHSISQKADGTRLSERRF